MAAGGAANRVPLRPASDDVPLGNRFLYRSKILDKQTAKCSAAEHAGAPILFGLHFLVATKRDVLTVLTGCFRLFPEF